MCQYSCVIYVVTRFVHSSGNSPLTIGEWSNEGCIATVFNASHTVCECNHLTHFAILLSPVPLDLFEKVALSLEVIGYTGVSISMVAMAITIITFVIFR